MTTNVRRFILKIIPLITVVTGFVNLVTNTFRLQLDYIQTIVNAESTTVTVKTTVILET